MLLSDLRHTNSLLVFHSIVKGMNTLEEISDDSKIAKITTNEILHDLENRKIITSYTNSKKPVGRPTKLYAISDLYNILYIETNPTYIVGAVFNAYGDKISELKVEINVLFPEKSALNKIINHFITSEIYKYTLETLLLYSNIDTQALQIPVTPTTTCDLILKSLCLNNNKTKLISLFNKKALLVNSNYKYVDVSAEELEKYLVIDEKIEIIPDDIPYEILESFTRIIVNHLEKLI